MAVPPEPVIFVKYTSAICGPNDPIILPRGWVKTDWKLELVVVIGMPGTYIAEAGVTDHIAGFKVCNDVSERAFQTERSGQWPKGKSSGNFGPIGTWLVTPDEVPDRGNLYIWLDVNGKRMQDGSRATMVCKLPVLLSCLSQVFTLHPGDVGSCGRTAWPTTDREARADQARAFALAAIFACASAAKEAGSR